jgi:hypothetical protein
MARVKMGKVEEGRPTGKRSGEEDKGRRVWIASCI